MSDRVDAVESFHDVFSFFEQADDLSFFERVFVLDIIVGFGFETDLQLTPASSLGGLGRVEVRGIDEDIEQFVVDLQLRDAFGGRVLRLCRDGRNELTLTADFAVGDVAVLVGLGLAKHLDGDDAGNFFGGRGVDPLDPAVGMGRAQRADDQLVGQVDVVGVLRGTRGLGQAINAVVPLSEQVRRLCGGPGVVRVCH